MSATRSAPGDLAELRAQIAAAKHADEPDLIASLLTHTGLDNAARGLI